MKKLGGMFLVLFAALSLHVSAPRAEESARANLFFFEIAKIKPYKYAMVPFHVFASVRNVKIVEFWGMKNMTETTKVMLNMADGEVVPAPSLEGVLYPQQVLRYEFPDDGGRELRSIDFDAKSSYFGDEGRIRVIIGYYPGQ